MRELSFSTGLETFKVNGGHEISFNPADVGFAEKLFDTFDRLAKRQDAGKLENQAYQNDGKKLFELARKRDEEMRQEIDDLFGEGTSAGVFGNLSTYAISDGFPIWANFLFAVIDTMDETIAVERAKSKPRVDTYLKKYKR